MSAEPRRVARPDVWTRWEGQVVNGVFPLLRFIGGSERGAVFLSEYNAGKTSDVAIKLVPAVPTRAEAQLARWRAAAGLSHPHLVRLFDMGRCQLEGREFLFVVMEYGEQTLAQFLSQHALNADEVRAVLLPTLDALTFLHGNQAAHGRLKPSNLLVVNDQLKLTSDSVRPAGQSGNGTADDMWSLGMVLVEAFTQRTLESTDQPYETSPLLADVPAQFANTVRRCLNPTPDSRPTAAELQMQYQASRPEHGASDDDRRQAHPLLLAIPAAFLVLFAALIGPRPEEDAPADSQPSAVPAPVPERARVPERVRTPDRAPAIERAPEPSKRVTTPTVSKSKPEASRAKSASSVSKTASPVVAEVIPEVPRALREKIQGRILVRMRVLVDPSGSVMAAMMESSGPNRNLANLADSAAREWKFLPAERQDTRVWILTFAFTREGVTARATAV